MRGNRAWYHGLRLFHTLRERVGVTNRDYPNRTPRHASPPISNQSGYRAYPRRQYQSAQKANSRYAPPRLTAQDLYPEYIVKRKRSRLLKRIGLCVLAVLLVAVCATGGYAFWYSSVLDGALSMGEEQDASVDAVLTEVNIEEPFYMLLLGSDSREGSGTSGRDDESGDSQRSDVMILARIDASSKQVTMVSIPRDTPLTLEDGSIVKINEAYNIGGAAYSIKAVSELTGVSISHYAEIHFSQLQEVVDKLGGVTVEVDTQLSYKDALTGETVTVEPGTQTLNGQQAQIFARARHEYQTDQDVHRQNNVRSLAEAILQKALEHPVYELPNTVLDLATCLGTDLNTPDVVSLALAFSGGSEAMAIYSCTGPSDGGINEAANGSWMCYPNPEGWATLMRAVDAGEDPSNIDVESMASIPETSESEAA